MPVCESALLWINIRLVPGARNFGWVSATEVRDAQTGRARCLFGGGSGPILTGALAIEAGEFGMDRAHRGIIRTLGQFAHLLFA